MAGRVDGEVLHSLMGDQRCEEARYEEDGDTVAR